MNKHSFLGLALLALAPAAFASGVFSVDNKQRVDAILDQQQHIRADIKAEVNGWEEIPSAKRNEVLSDQDRLFVLLEGKQVISDLPADRQVEAANLLEKINAVVTGAEDERKVCTRERKVGSNFTQRVCRKVADIRKEQEAIRAGLESGSNNRKFNLEGSLRGN